MDLRTGNRVDGLMERWTDGVGGRVIYECMPG